MADPKASQSRLNSYGKTVATNLLLPPAFLESCNECESGLFQGVALEVTRMHNQLDASLCLEVVLYVFVSQM